MSSKGLIFDLAAPGWATLNPEQKICWHFWAAQNPKLVQDGQLRTLWGWQGYYSTNAPLYVLETPAPLTDPPADDEPAPQLKFHSIVWRRSSKRASGPNKRGSSALVYFDAALPPHVAAIITQTYTRRRNKPNIDTGNRHVITLGPGDTGAIELTAPNGYFATTAGNTSWARIKGKTAIRRPDLPMGRIQIINLTNAQVTETPLDNPTGGRHKRLRRPKHYP